ncbi:glutamic acid-rich protein-like [Ostrea edulis]|uniref:glutamic acid-rich protein-like n=1 Tax=Ostrea edulis TaxID=37623 RepID=UPI0024AFFE11|nr:glutamic acid-rich protein-like [Ostrea edulis]
MSGRERETDPLPILGEDGAVFQYGDPRRVPPQGSNKAQSRRTPTPTKQVNLKVVSRRGDSPECEDFVDMEELRQSLSRENSRIFEPKEEEKVIHGANSKSTRRGHSCSHGDGYEKPFVVPSKAPKPQQKKPVKAPPKVVEKKPPPEGAEGGKEDSSNSDSEEEEEEERKAPSELLMEFLECLMKKEYTIAAKLCKMILIYEPNHPTALQFQPVLEDKILIEEEKEKESGNDESGDDESDDSGEDSDDDDDDDEDDDDKSESSESDEEEERNSADEFFDEFKQDSGIASASSD